MTGIAATIRTLAVGILDRSLLADLAVIRANVNELAGDELDAVARFGRSRGRVTQDQRNALEDIATRLRAEVAQ